MSKLNCWTFMQCGREAGGKNVTADGPCPAALSTLADGINGGANGGRICWMIRGTQCGEGALHGYAGQDGRCGGCEFRHLVEDEENNARFPDETETDFAALPIRAGAKMQFQTLDGKERRHYGRYVGAISGRSVLVVTPDDLWRQEGQRLIVRVFAGKYAYAFHTRILYCYARPSPYIHLAWPPSVTAKRVRTSQRVRAGIFGQAVRLEAENGTPVPVVVWDISTTGAAIEPERSLGGDGVAVSLAFPLHFEEVESEIAVRGVLRNVRETTAGVEFGEMNTADRLLLHYFVDYRVAENAEM